MMKPESKFIATLQPVVCCGATGANTDMFLTEYIILAIHLNSQGVLSDVVLNKVKENADLMI